MSDEYTLEDILSMHAERLDALERERWAIRHKKLEWFGEEKAPVNHHQTTPGRVSWTIRGQA